MDIPVLYEDDNYIVLNKPAGLVVHSDGRSKEPTLADWLIENRPDLKDIGEPIILSNGEKILKPGIVHRLDKDTSGAIAVAKNQPAFDHLKKKFQIHEVSKEYHAFVYGDVKEDDSTINRPIGRSKSDFRKWSAQRGARGEMREAITNYKVLARAEVPAIDSEGNTVSQKVTLVEVRPKTGRTHQIRVHFKAIHHPVVGDSLYAANQPKVLGFERQALHARSIFFRGIQDVKVEGIAPYPEDFARAVEMIKKPV